MDEQKHLTSPKGNCLPGNCVLGKQQVAESAEDLLQYMHEHQELEAQPIQLKNCDELQEFRWIVDLHKVNDIANKNRWNFKKNHFI